MLLCAAAACLFAATPGDAQPPVVGGWGSSVGPDSGSSRGTGQPIVAGQDRAVAQDGTFQEAAWHEKTPRTRSRHVMAYDAARKKTVLFGGSTAFGTDTWTWDGTRWQKEAASGPGPRCGAAMAYDGVRQEVVLFGGDNCALPSRLQNASTWAWNGVEWRQKSVTGPSARVYHAMVFDEVRGQVVLFGGEGAGGVYLGDTWVWDGSSWQPKSVAGPPARSGHAMAHDGGRGEVVIFGGAGRDAQGYHTYFRDTWTWDGSSWRIATSPTAWPSARSASAMVYDPARGEVVLFDGSSWLGDTWTWNGSTWTKRGVTGPDPRYWHAMAYDSARHEVVLFGGMCDANHSDAGDTWTWNGSQWIEKLDSGPWPRYGHAVVFDEARGQMILHGGWDESSWGERFGFTWAWDGGQWVRKATAGPGKYHHAATYDAVRRQVVVFGGSEYHAWNGGTWVWDGARWEQKQVAEPPVREGSAMVFDAARGHAVLFGGAAASPYGDTWVWNGTLWTQVSASGPSARSGHAMAYDAARSEAILFGGVDAYGVRSGETWAWNGSGWRQVSASGPAARSGHAMAYDPRARKVVLFGGHDGTSEFGDTWTWDGREWRQIAGSGPPPRSWFGMAYDPRTERLVMFGGELVAAHSVVGDTWELSLGVTDLPILPPTIGAVVPNAGPLAGANQVTITGSNFVPGGTTVAFGALAGGSVAVTSPTALTVVVPPATAVGPVTVAVTTVGGTASLPNGYTYVSAPSLTGLAPSRVRARSNAFTLTVTGATFAPGAVVLWDGAVRPTTFVTSGVLHAWIPSSDVSVAATVPVTVRNPSGATSAPLAFEVFGSWLIAGTGQFNGDTMADLVWQSAEGYVAAWLMNGTTQASSTLLYNYPVAVDGWRVAAAGDLNADGSTDLIWQHKDGWVAAWIMKGTAQVMNSLLYDYPVAVDGWRIVAAGDLNGDRMADLVWQHDSGWVGVWVMNGIRQVSNMLLYDYPVAVDGWSIAGVGDFTKDGITDLVWQSESGYVAVWIMRGTTQVANMLLSPQPVAVEGWRIAGAGDLNGDGSADLLWHRDDGWLAAWLMNGTTTVMSTLLTPNRALSRVDEY